MVDIHRTVKDLSSGIQQVLDRQEWLEESLAKKTLELEDIGWVPLNTRPDGEGQGLTLTDLHGIVPKLRDAAAVDPLHVRGAQLRHSYVFGKGINFDKVEGTRAERAMADLHNQSAMFSVGAYETLNLALFTDGNVFVIRNEVTNLLTVVPLSQIVADVVDEDDPTRVLYLLRQWHNGTDVVHRWYPVSRYKKTQVGRGRRGQIAKTIKYNGQTVPVAQDAVMYHEATKRQAGWTYGIPDSLAAAVWAVAYRQYLTNSATLVEALQQFAWSVTTSSKKTHSQVGVQVAQQGVGGTAALGGDSRIASVGVPSAQVDFNKGQPLAAMVATSFGVPVIALLSSPGASGGTYGVAASLDTPTIKVMSAVQDSWKMLYTEILRDMGAPDVVVTFPNLNEDETYRTLQAIGLAMADGRLWRDEARDKTAELLDIKKTHVRLPVPDEFNAGSYDINDTSNPEPQQGNTGAVPGGVDQDRTADDQHGDDD